MALRTLASPLLPSHEPARHEVIQAGFSKLQSRDLSKKLKNKKGIWILINFAKKEMPIISHHTIQPEGEIGLWQITEPQSWFLRRLKPKGDELEQLQQIKGKSRRLEWMAVRWLIHKMSGRRKRSVCLKDEHGKPHLVDSPWEISFSHSKQLVTVIAAPKLVGIDIQNITPSIERIAHKFMRAEELKSLKPKTRLEHLHVYWGAKEALYKAYGKRQLDFRQHIFIHPFKYDIANGKCKGYVLKDKVELHFNLFYKKIDNHILVHAVKMETGKRANEKKKKTRKTNLKK